MDADQSKRMDNSPMMMLPPAYSLAISLIRETLDGQEENMDATLNESVLGVGEDNHEGVNVNKGEQFSQHETNDDCGMDWESRPMKVLPVPQCLRIIGECCLLLKSCS